MDIGVLHALLNLKNLDEVLGHFVAGSSFENLVLMQLLPIVGKENIYFYRTAEGTEMDFVITKGGEALISIKVTLSSAPKTTKSFTTALQDLKTKHNFIVAPILSGYPLKDDVHVVSIQELVYQVKMLWFDQ